MNGNGQLFTRQDASETCLAHRRPVLGDTTPPHIYEPGTWGPADVMRVRAAQRLDRSGEVRGE